MAGADENRTHQGRDTPPSGFEDRERHQTTSCSHAGKMSEGSIFIGERQPWVRLLGLGAFDAVAAPVLGPIQGLVGAADEGFALIAFL